MDARCAPRKLTRVFRPQMSMIWNTDPVGHCLVFPSLQITRSTIVLYLTASAYSFRFQTERTICNTTAF